MNIIKSKKSSTDKYDTSKYKISGIYRNTDDAKMEEYFLIDKENNMSWYMGLVEQTEHIIEPKSGISAKDSPKIKPTKEDEKGRVSEAFALKMLSIATKNDKYKEL